MRWNFVVQPKSPVKKSPAKVKKTVTEPKNVTDAKKSPAKKVAAKKTAMKKTVAKKLSSKKTVSKKVAPRGLASRLLFKLASAFLGRLVVVRFQFFSCKKSQKTTTLGKENLQECTLLKDLKINEPNHRRMAFRVTNSKPTMN